MPVANFVESVVVYDDVENASNPVRKHVDWKRSATGLVFEQAYSERFTLAPGASRSIFSPPTYYDSLSAVVDFAAVTAKPTWYQVRGLSSTGSNGIGFPTGSLVLAAQVDGSMYASGAGISANGAVPGDWVYLAGSTYGDVGVVSADNQGFWVITAVSNGFYMRRAYPEDPLAVTETVTVSATTDIQYTPNMYRSRWVFPEGAGIFSGLKACMGVAVGWAAFPAESRFVPTTGVIPTHVMLTPQYSAYVRVESDKPLLLQMGDINYHNLSNEVTLLPVVGGAPAWYEAFAFTLVLNVQNRGSETATINLVYAIAKTEN